MKPVRNQPRRPTLTEMTAARPLSAAFASAASFAVGAALPLAAALLVAPRLTAPVVSVASPSPP